MDSSSDRIEHHQARLLLTASIALQPVLLLRHRTSTKPAERGLASRLCKQHAAVGPHSNAVLGAVGPPVHARGEVLVRST